MRRVGAIVAMALLTGCSLGGPADDATGEDIYAQLCARCHGADLDGGVGPALGPGSAAASEDDEYIEFTISEGRGRMPSFESLQADQLDRLVDYVRGVQADE